MTFARTACGKLIKIKTAWQGLNYTTGKGVLILSLSNPSHPSHATPVHG